MRPFDAAIHLQSGRSCPPTLDRVDARLEDKPMDKDRIKGSVEQATGAVKETVGKVAGDAKLEVEGRNEKADGKVQNAVGGVKDALRDALKK